MAIYKLQSILKDLRLIDTSESNVVKVEKLRESVKEALLVIDEELTEIKKQVSLLRYK